MATADLGAMAPWGLLSLSPLIDLLRAFAKRILLVSRSKNRAGDVMVDDMAEGFATQGKGKKQRK